MRCAPRRATSPTPSSMPSPPPAGSSGSSSRCRSCAPTAPTSPTRRCGGSSSTSAMPPTASASSTWRSAPTSTARRSPTSSATSPACRGSSTRCWRTASPRTRCAASPGTTGGGPSRAPGAPSAAAGRARRAARPRARADRAARPVGTTWPEYPPPAVDAITYAARRGLHRYLDPHATALRSELAHHLGVDEERVVVGGGIAQLMGAAAQALLEPGDELVTPWPSYPLYPVIARRSRGHAVPVPGFGPEAVLRAVNDRTRIVALCNPNDPTGELVAAPDLAALLDALPERVVVLLDEALRDFADAEPRDAAVALGAEHPRLLVFRTFSKAWGLAGLRCGYAVGGPGAEPLLAQLEPELGLDELAQAGALEALRTAARLVAGRAAAVARERARLAAGAAAAGVDVGPSQANVLWLAGGGVDRGQPPPPPQAHPL